MTQTTTLQNKAADAFANALHLLDTLHESLAHRKSVPPGVMRQLKRLPTMLAEFKAVYGVESDDPAFLLFQGKELTDAECTALLTQGVRDEITKAINKLTGKIED